MLDIHLDMSGTQQTLYTPAVIPERNLTILPVLEQMLECKQVSTGIRAFTVQKHVEEFPK
jgi:hypothetical protein